MPDAPADAGNSPEGRSDPGGPKIGGFPLWVWGIAAVGTFGVVWFLRNRNTATAGAGTQVGGASGTNPDLGVTTTDPMTAAALLQQMQDLATRLSKINGTSVLPGISPSPPVITTPGSGGLAPGPIGPSVVSNAGTNVSTSHTSGGSSTAQVAASHLPEAATTPSIIGGILQKIQDGFAAGTATVIPIPAPPPPAPVKAGLLGIAWPWNQPPAPPPAPIFAPPAPTKFHAPGKGAFE